MSTGGRHPEIACGVTLRGALGGDRDEVVDLVDRRGGALDHAHVQHLLQRFGGREGTHKDRAGAAIVLGESVDVLGDR